MSGHVAGSSSQMMGVCDTTQTERQIDRHTDRQTERQRDIAANIRLKKKFSLFGF